METQHGILLPLSAEGNITCATCHNPHEKGVIPDRRLGARGASLTRRHRLQHDMCIKCHPMREISVN
jgi:cytochrome c peroxidase